MLKFCQIHGKCLLLETASHYSLSGGRQAGFPSVSVSIADAITRLLAAKRAGNRRPAYLKSLSEYLIRFAAGREQRPLAEFTTADVESWLERFPVDWSKQTQLNRINTLFAFAVRRDFIVANPCKKIERITVDRRPPKIFTPEQVELLLRMVPGVCRAYLILGLFAGIRPEETLRLNWSDVDLETKTVRVNAAKTRRRRIEPMNGRCQMFRRRRA
jgi:integrase